MSRPANCIASEGSTPLTASVVDFWKNSGKISTRPPMAITSRISTTIRKLLVSTFSWEKPLGAGGLLSNMARPSLTRSGMRRVHGRNGYPDRTAGAGGQPDVPGHHQHAGQIQQATGQADHVERVAGFDAFDTGVAERAVRIDGAPHQALHHTGNPHRGDIQHDADGGQPEMQLDGLDGVHLVLAEQARH